MTNQTEMNFFKSKPSKKGHDLKAFNDAQKQENTATSLTPPLSSPYLPRSKSLSRKKSAKKGPSANVPLPHPIQTEESSDDQPEFEGRKSATERIALRLSKVVPRLPFSDSGSHPMPSLENQFPSSYDLKNSLGKGLHSTNSDKRKSFNNSHSSLRSVKGASVVSESFQNLSLSPVKTDAISDSVAREKLGLSLQKETMPSPREICKEFESFLQEMSIPPEKQMQMREFETERKWILLQQGRKKTDSHSSSITPLLRNMKKDSEKQGDNLSLCQNAKSVEISLRTEPIQYVPSLYTIS